MIYTFYSFKGGVGRSMALAAVAYLFAKRGLRVLAIDFDLEAPGLERYFFEGAQARALREHLGLIDLLDTYKKAMTSEAEFSQARFKRWWDFVDEAVPSIPGGGKVDIMTAGRREPEEKLREYALAVRSFDWQDFFANWNGEKFFDWLRKQLMEPPEGAEHPGYDVVLVDSRTGVTEMGGVSAYQLADCAVMLCAANYQNLEGTLAVARDFRSDPVLALRRGRPLELLVIPARLEGSHPKRKEFLARFAETFGPVEFFPKVLSDAGLESSALALPYEPEFAVIERLVGDGENPETQTARQAIASFERLADALTLLAPAGPGRLGEQRDAAFVRLTGREAENEKTVEQVADPTLRSAGFDVYLDAPRADQALASRLAAELTERGLRVLYAEEPSLLALGLAETLVVCFGESGSSEFANKLVSGVRERRQGAPAIVPLLLASKDDPCPSGRAAARALELESELVYLDPARQGWVERLLAALRRARPATRAKAPDLDRDPYPGERAFAEDDAALFFGRDEEIAVLFERTEKNRITWLIGPAGVGKSSLIGAGLVPRWRQHLAGRPSTISVIDFASGQNISQVSIVSPQSGQAMFRRIVLDHADSFPAGGDPAAREARIAEIGKMATGLAEGDRLVVVCRDVFGDEDRHRLFEACRPDASFWLDPLPSAALQQAIERPAGRAGHLFEQGLVQLLVENAGSAASSVAQVQRLLPELWKERKRGWLTTTAYNRSGGVAGAFERAFAEFRAGLEPEEKQAADTLLRSLTYFDRNLRLQADFADWQDLATIPDLAAVDAVALRDSLAGRHFIDLHRGSPSTSEKERTRVGLVFPNPGAYGKDFETAPDPEFLLWRRRLAGQLAGWRQNNKEEGYLVTGRALAEAEDHATENHGLLTDAERELITSSVQLRGIKEDQDREAELARRETQELREARESAIEERDRAIAAQEAAEVQRRRADAAVRMNKRWLAIWILVAIMAGILAARFYREAEELRSNSLIPHDSLQR